MSGPLFLLHLPVNIRALARIAAERNRGVISYKGRQGGERDAGLDEGRVLHHLLDETFGPAALRPFRLMVAPHGGTASIYAYTRCTQTDLQQAIRESSMPEGGRVFGLDDMSFREVASDWPSGRRLAFDVRVRPVVRIRIALPNPRATDNPYKAGSELDAYFVEAQRRFPDDRPRMVDGHPVPSAMERDGRSREVVYRDWLADRVAPAADMDLATVKLHRFERTRVARQGHAPEGPDATLHGELVIKDSVAFGELLAAGVGRHKAYGFGMLLLRPVRRRGEQEF